MAKIEVHFKKVRSVGNDFNSHTSHLTTSINKAASATSLVDYRIKQRRNIASDIHQVNESLRTLKSDLTKLQSFIVKSADCYEEAEKKVEKLAKDFNRESLLDKAKKVNKLIDNVIKVVSAGTLKELVKGVHLKLYFEDGKIKIRHLIGDLDLNNPQHYFKVRDALNEMFGGSTGRYKKNFLMKMANGLPLYAIAGLFSGHAGNQSNLMKFKFLQNTPTFNREMLKPKFTTLLLDEAKSTYQNFTKLTEGPKLERAGKFFGAVGTALDFVDNVQNASKEKTWSGKFTTFTSGMAVDVGVGVGSAAIGMKFGAGIGAMLPPIGIFAGAAAGAAIGVGIDWALSKEFFVDKEGKFTGEKGGKYGATDVAKYYTKKGLDAGVKVGKNALKSVKSAWKSVSLW